LEFAANGGRAGHWRMERPSTSARIKYTNEPIGEPRVIKDFLPSPAELAFRDVKITITRDPSSRSVRGRAKAARVA
jgi:hypothetical protein